MYKTAEFICHECQHRWDTIVEAEIWNEEMEVTCPECNHTQKSKRVVSAPMILNASLPDGWRRKHDDNYIKMREAVKLRREEVNLPPEKRKEIKKAREDLIKVKK